MRACVCLSGCLRVCVVVGWFLCECVFACVFG